MDGYTKDEFGDEAQQEDDRVVREETVMTSGRVASVDRNTKVCQMLSQMADQMNSNVAQLRQLIPLVIYLPILVLISRIYHVRDFLIPLTL
ncbi:hypothetical protein Pmani_021318 [Petrolisthes manimaculis]|uniref:Uncharacterized protein n=1 Tax=Petrolisthes manimaculis TaxID=1843537 RepID=A0AAE1PED9_9EUCA|nr:hypothetical protein Pmani_021318 [Petrolisthes manimaculis]